MWLPDPCSTGVSGEHHPVPPAPEDSLSRALQDTFSFLEDSSSSDLGADDGEMELGVPTAAEDDPGLGYMDELLVAGRQVWRVREGWVSTVGRSQF